MDPAIVLLAIRAILRLGAAARDAYVQDARDRAIIVAGVTPLPPERDGDTFAQLSEAMLSEPPPAPAIVAEIEALLAQFSPITGRWASETVRRAAESMLATLTGHRPVGVVALTAGIPAADGRILFELQQWSDKHRPVAPLQRLAVAFVDVALEVVAARPGLLGLGGQADKLVSALAGNLAELIDPATLGAAGGDATAGFAERALVVVLRAGLTTLGEEADTIVGEEHYRRLLKAVVAPLVQLFATTPATRLRVEDLRERLLGPLAKAALGVLAESPAAFFGPGLDPSTAAGAVGKTVLETLAKGDLGTLGKTDGIVVDVFQALLRLAAARPELLIGGAGALDTAAKALVTRLATVAGDAETRLGSPEMASRLIVAALEAVREASPRLVAAADLPDAVAGVVEGLLKGLQGSLGAGGGEAAFARVMGPAGALDLLRSVLAETGAASSLKAAAPEAAALVAAFARAIAAPGSDLMRREAWIALAGEAARLALRNPGRLTAAAADSQPVARILETLLAAATRAATAAGAEPRGALLFGETLRQAASAALRALAGNAAGLANAGQLGELVDRLNALARATPPRIGADDWLQLFERHVAQVLDQGLPASLDPAALLAGLRS